MVLFPTALVSNSLCVAAGIISMISRTMGVGEDDVYPFSEHSSLIPVCLLTNRELLNLPRESYHQKGVY